ncbi:unsaturated chondroitin disaccharide hydrolase [Clostridium moniliforme]|uniref:Unsaturated chondroitin disaccharide hydrolase n=1 Tax=Clostridium moniliforme TaxID=39489 RepID=A0ABS4F1U4_9CLOT|nr:glycoside hydrolase family 88 protein [Clostridium moniliforme]MBP1890214.1 unsaturated chondroitin disaccharide hydrolase [Clostridium moniliforme]
MIKEIAIEKIKDESKFTNSKQLTKEEVKKALDDAIKIIDKDIEKFGERFPHSASKDGKYKIIDNVEWTTGFWTGMLWLAYEYTGDEKYKNLAQKNVDDFMKRIDEKIEVNHHDMGFLYSISCVADYKLTGSEKAKEAALKAADHLMTRYQEKGKFIQAWGNMGEDYRLIIDCLMNIPLLYWASKVTGDKKYYETAHTHFKTSCNYVIRDDGSTFHTYYFDNKTGKPLKGVTKQGYSDDSSWARGQAWGVYGVPLTYRYTKDKDAFRVYEAVTNYFLNRLPKDNVCFWDLIFNDGDDHPRDSSAAAIAVCGMLEMNKYLPDTNEYKDVYKNASNAIMRSLIENYTPDPNGEEEGLLLHGVYGWHANNGVDECTTWGDYYYMEALMRLYKDWNLYW